MSKIKLQRSAPFIKVYQPFHSYYRGGRCGTLLSVLLTNSIYFENIGKATDGWFFQSNKYLLQKLGMLPKTLRSLRNRLIEDGCIECSQIGNKATQYKILVDGIAKIMDVSELFDMDGIATARKPMRRTIFSKKTTKKGKEVQKPVKIKRTKWPVKKKKNMDEPSTPRPKMRRTKYPPNFKKKMCEGVLSAFLGGPKYPPYKRSNTRSIFINSYELICRHSPTEYIEIIQKFNSLEGTTRHNLEKPSKLIERVIHQIDRLMDGEHIEPRKNGEPFGPLQKFYNEYQIPPKLQTKKWTKNQILEILPKAVALSRQSSSSRISMPNVFYNSKFGFSSFLKAASMSHGPNKRLEILAMKFKRNLANEPSPVWVVLHKLEALEQKHGLTRLKEMFNWIVAKQGQMYIPTVFNTDDFILKFDKINAAMMREEPTVKNTSKYGADYDDGISIILDNSKSDDEIRALMGRA